MEVFTLYAYRVLAWEPTESESSCVWLGSSETAQWASPCLWKPHKGANSSQIIVNHLFCGAQATVFFHSNQVIDPLASLVFLCTEWECFTWLWWSQVSVPLKIMAWEVPRNTWSYNYVQLDWSCMIISSAASWQDKGYLCRNLYEFVFSSSWPSVVVVSLRFSFFTHQLSKCHE